jgi:hypothetical protein
MLIDAIVSNKLAATRTLYGSSIADIPNSWGFLTMLIKPSKVVLVKIL